jgi:hypothetical protein
MWMLCERLPPPPAAEAGRAKAVPLRRLSGFQAAAAVAARGPRPSAGLPALRPAPPVPALLLPLLVARLKRHPGTLVYPLHRC